MSIHQKAFRKTHDVIANFLKINGYEETLESFYKEGGDFINLTRNECDVLLEKGDKKLYDLVESDLILRANQEGLVRKEKEKVSILDGPEINLSLIKCSDTFDMVHFSNILTIKAFELPSLSQEGTLMITSGTDKSIKVSTLNGGKLVNVVNDPHLGGSVISVDIHPLFKNLMISSSMDFSVSLTDLNEDELVKRWNHHVKFAHIVRFSPDGSTFFSASYDHNLVLYRQKENSSKNQDLSEKDLLPSYDLHHTFRFDSRIEAACYSPDSEWIIISLRDDNYLYYLNTNTFEQLKCNMNSNGDNIVSFNVMDICVSPNKTHLLCATDHRSGRLILFKLFTATQARNYYGVVQDDMSNPKITFYPTGKYFFVTSDTYGIQMFDIDQEVPIKVLEGHKGLVRTLDFDKKEMCLLSGSYDKTIKIWQF